SFSVPHWPVKRLGCIATLRRCMHASHPSRPRSFPPLMCGRIRFLPEIPMPRKIIIDTDPGQDDAVALLLALASPEELEVLGVVAVAGNVSLEHNARNARKIVELAGRPDIAVYAGCSRPLRRQLVTAEHVHGDTGLNGPDLPEPTIQLQDQHGVDYII